jgi:proteasome assembly chaperone (PAC2) family protein
MPSLQIDRVPELHDPVMVVAFSGWNDAASAATDAAKFLVERLSARRFAAVDPEEFYDFSETRPTVAIAPSGERTINWPKNEFHYARNPIGAHDVVIAIGVEPNLGWRTFGECHLEVRNAVNAGLFVSLGALLADVPHTRPTRVTGTALDPTVAARLDLTTSRYQGPTGIVGVLHDALRRADVPAASLWANVPHYITTSQNPPATRALLSRVQEILGLTLDLRELDAASERFVHEVDTALAAQPEIAGYVRALEESADAGPSDAEETLPSGEDFVVDVEEFLRRQRED